MNQETEEREEIQETEEPNLLKHFCVKHDLNACQFAAIINTLAQWQGRASLSRQHVHKWLEGQSGIPAAVIALINLLDSPILEALLKNSIAFVKNKK